MNQIIDIFGDYYIDEHHDAHRYNRFKDFLFIRSLLIRDYEMFSNNLTFKWYIRVINNSSKSSELSHLINYIYKENIPIFIKNELLVYLLNRSNYDSILIESSKTFLYKMTDLEVLNFIKIVPNNYLIRVLEVFDPTRIGVERIFHYLECRNIFFKGYSLDDYKLMEGFLRKFSDIFQIEDGEDLFIETNHVEMKKNIFSHRPTKKLLQELMDKSDESREVIISFIKDPTIRFNWFMKYQYYSKACKELNQIKRYKEFLKCIGILSLIQYNINDLEVLFIDRLRKTYSRKDYEMVYDFLEEIKHQNNALYEEFKNLIKNNLSNRRTLLDMIYKK